MDCPACQGAGEIRLCDHCDTAPATHFLELDSPHDPCCEACHAKLFTECPRCQAEVMVDDLVSFESCRATRYDPAEYETGCTNCLMDRGDDRSADDAPGWED
jgi:hypothetical protein